jgi:cobalt-zinc-cadmium efflux system protein
MHVHNHGHTHDHTVPRDKNRARLACTLGLTLIVMIAEVIGGWLSGSLALLADAGHMFSDAAALGLSLFAIWIAQRPAKPRHTYGYYRAEILAALVNGSTLVAISIFIFVEAYQRFRAPPEVQGPLMAAIALVGLLVNLAGLALLHSGRNDSLNIQGAWLHLLTDALGSVSALAAAGLIWRFGWYWVDPVASVLIGLLVIYSSYGLLSESINILMESAPSHLNIAELESAMAGLTGVTAVHDLHVWTITSGMVSLSAHVVADGRRDARELLTDVHAVLHDRFGIEHSTIQIEQGSVDECRTAF